MDIVNYEEGTQTEEETLEMFQNMINNGSVWQFQGSYGRTAMDLIQSGQCVLGEKSFRDYYGSKIPSRYEVKPGTAGSVEYQQKFIEEVF